jgi:hypothetical protein
LRSGRGRSRIRCVSMRFLKRKEYADVCVVLGHQDWLDGLVTAASGKEIGETNLEAVGFPVRK